MPDKNTESLDGFRIFLTQQLLLYVEKASIFNLSESPQ